MGKRKNAAETSETRGVINVPLNPDGQRAINAWCDRTGGSKTRFIQRLVEWYSVAHSFVGVTVAHVFFPAVEASHLAGQGRVHYGVASAALIRFVLVTGFAMGWYNSRYPFWLWFLLFLAACILMSFVTAPLEAWGWRKTAERIGLADIQ